MGNCCSDGSSDKKTVDVASRKEANGKKKVKKNQKGATLPEGFILEFAEDDTGAGIKNEDLWEDPDELKVDKITDEQYFKEDNVTLQRKGKTMPLFKEEVIEKVRDHLSDKIRKLHQTLGPFVYRKSELNSLKLNEDELEIRDVEKDGDMYYVGQWNAETNSKEGRGIAVFTNGAIYEGFWKNDVKNGAGRFIYETGDVYQGEWKNNKCNGYGVFQSGDKLKAKGYWKDDQLSGQGFEVTDTGTTYRGSYNQGEKEGKGKIVYKSGNTYVGDFSKSNYNGEGTFTFSDGKEYIGEMKDGKMHGKGVFKWTNGALYEGDYAVDVKHGFGRYVYQNGDIYEGLWDDNKMNGEGNFTKSGVTKRYLFENGAPKKEIKVKK